MVQNLKTASLKTMKKTLFHFAAWLAVISAGYLGKPTEAKAQAYDMICQDTLIATSPGLMSHSFSFYLYQNCNPAPVNFFNTPWYTARETA